MTVPWLSIIGIGEDGRKGLGEEAIARVEGADLVVGGARHLALFGKTPGAQKVWDTPLAATIPAILARRPRPVAVLASGDPFWFGAGVTLARHVPSAEMQVFPAASSFSLAAARLGWALQDTVTLGLNVQGAVPAIRPHLHHGARLLALSLGAETPAEIAALLTACGFGSSRITVLEALGGPHERLREAQADRFGLDGIHSLNIVAVEVAAGPDASPIPRSCGLPDSLFETDGALTKREIRAVTLAFLMPGAGELLWDVGLGSGSVAIEWLLAHPANRAIGVEQDTERAACAARNAAALGVGRLGIRQGIAPDALAGLAPPDAVFIGGGGGTPGLIETCWTSLKPGGRIVANAVTLETETALLAARTRFGGRLTRLAVERADAIGSRLGWRPARPVVLWAAGKPRSAP